MKKLHTIYYLTGKLTDGAAYVDCMLREGLRHQLAKNWQIQGQGTLQWTQIKTPRLLVAKYNYSCLTQHSDQTTLCKLNTWQYII